MKCFIGTTHLEKDPTKSCSKDLSNKSELENGLIPLQPQKMKKNTLQDKSVRKVRLRPNVVATTFQPVVRIGKLSFYMNIKTRLGVKRFNHQNRRSGLN